MLSNAVMQLQYIAPPQIKLKEGYIIKQGYIIKYPMKKEGWVWFTL